MNLTSELAPGCERRGMITKCRIEDACNAPHRLVFKRTAHDLPPYGEAFGRAADRDYGGRSRKHIKPLRVADSIEVLDLTALQAPGALAMLECRNTRHRAQQQRKLAHRFERLFAQQIEFCPGIQQFGCSERRSGLGDGEELCEDGAQLIVSAADGGLVEHRSALHKEFTPQLAP